MSKEFNFKEGDGMTVQISPIMAIREDLVTDNIEDMPDAVPVIPLRNMVAMPHITMPILLGREMSITAARDAESEGGYILIIAQRDASKEKPIKKDLYNIGVIARILKLLNMPDGTVTALVHTGKRVNIGKLVQKTPYMRAEYSSREEKMPDAADPEMIALYGVVTELYMKILSYAGENETQEIKFTLKNLDNPLREINYMISNSPLDYDAKQQLLEIDDFKTRAAETIKHFQIVNQLMKIKADIQTRTREDLSQQQKEHFLHQQIRTIQDELGYNIGDDDTNELRSKAEKKIWPEYVANQFIKELKRLERYNPQSPEYAIQYVYLETLLALPWLNCSDKVFSLSEVDKILNRDHYGLKDVKERIMEYMAVMKLRKDMKAPIICLYGPPGVGKTSLGKSIADALGREYARISLGGLHDEAEIRGHRKTYVGAMPGRIISAMKKCGTSNPVFVLDEIDKIGQDFKGDPSTALLEVLDPEQNNKFHDNYLDIDYDLSKVLFIATANSLSTISRPLLDRMEVIEIPGYIIDEKVEIALRHLIPKVLEEHGMQKDELTFTREGITKIIESYTRESGVRLLEKKIAAVIRKIAVKKASDTEYPTVITEEIVREYLGPEEVTPDMYENNKYYGVVTGLAWTQVGGEILFIESSLSPGKGEKLTLTGNLGDVMKESAVIALQYLKANADELGIDSKIFELKDVHIHVPEGAIPKDGPSAGITMVTSLASSFTHRKIREKLAMTGEITLRGKVLPVGGIKEKVFAAKRAGITDIILCRQNERDISKIEDMYLEGLTFHYVDDIKEVLDYALLPAE
jgi:ATP-dependent Lon protease